MSNEWPELGYQIAYQTFLELRSGRLFDIMNLHPLSTLAKIIKGGGLLPFSKNFPGQVEQKSGI